MTASLPNRATMTVAETALVLGVHRDTAYGPPRRLAGPTTPNPGPASLTPCGSRAGSGRSRAAGTPPSGGPARRARAEPLSLPGGVVR
ncbi:hypothetical protein [Planotetraspora mira]|uniref:Uncharacterized protein n=1 Tax=Planotetraspora mira TaxID=58121 RepID=A0A8J3XAS8_9ACTN|nr:hypothetical protein [Planotetraspora mira]GII33861.1 hypothetical protein Pmi06nite_73030 [Planotetraspora mira]